MLTTSKITVGTSQISIALLEQYAETMISAARSCANHTDEPSMLVCLDSAELSKRVLYAMTLQELAVLPLAGQYRLRDRIVLACMLFKQQEIRVGRPLRTP